MKDARTGFAPRLVALKRELAAVARAGALFVEGDLCRQAYAPGLECFAGGDDLNYHAAACVTLKKTLLRLERLARTPCCVALWRVRPDKPECVEPLLYGSRRAPLGDAKPAVRGYRPLPMFTAFRQAYHKRRPSWRLARDAQATGADYGLAHPARAGKRRVIVEHFVPVLDSMGEVAAVLEVFTDTTL